MEHKKNSFFLRIFLPAILTIVLFVGMLFIVIIPNTEENLMNVKKDMIKELTNSAWNIINETHRLEINNEISQDSAKKIAYNLIQHLKYGDENKDYFWITDMQPKMIMHPFRDDLEGKDLSNFKDPHGKKLFVECINVVKKNNSGYIDYMWQWKDDSLHIVPKLSYVRAFEPWQWVVGTGIYVEDVRFEISNLTRKSLIISTIISLLIIFLLFFILRQNLNLEKLRRQAEIKLLESKDRYKALVGATTEGVLLILENKVIYYNSIFVELTKIDSRLLSEINISKTFKDHGLELLTNQETAGKKEILLNDNKTSVLVNYSPITLSGKTGTIFIIKDITSQSDKESEFTNLLRVGYFKILLKSRSKFITVNNEFLRLTSYNRETIYNISPFNILGDSQIIKEITNEFNKLGKINSRIIEIKSQKKESVFMFTSLWLSKNENNENYCEGVIMNITDWINSFNLLQNNFSELSQHYNIIFQNVSEFCKTADQINMNTAQNNFSTYFFEKNFNVALINDNNGNIIGYTYRDYINNQKNTTNNNSATDFLISPIPTIDENNSISDALSYLHKNLLIYLFVKNRHNQIIGYLSEKLIIDLISTWPYFIEHQISKLNTTSELKIFNNNLPYLLSGFINGYESAPYVTKILSNITNKITSKIIENAIEQIGPAPVDFSFLTLGSLGREERTFITDQDNALIFQDSENNLENHKYFLRLSNIICDNLNSIGLIYCPGNIMAKNPDWCQPISKWKEYFQNWITKPDPQHILDISIFFDFKHLYGSEYLANNLKTFISDNIMGNSPLLFQMARNILNYKLPLSAFGALILENSGESVGKFNIKTIMVPIVMLSRLYSLKYNISENNTVKRITELAYTDKFNNEKSNEILNEFNFVTYLRLKSVIKTDFSTIESDCFIDIKKLTGVEENMLKKIVSQISQHISILNSDFKGAGEVR